MNGKHVRKKVNRIIPFFSLFLLTACSGFMLEGQGISIPPVNLSCESDGKSYCIVAGNPLLVSAGVGNVRNPINDSEISKELKMTISDMEDRRSLRIAKELKIIVSDLTDGKTLSEAKEVLKKSNFDCIDNYCYFTSMVYFNSNPFNKKTYNVKLRDYFHVYSTLISLGNEKIVKKENIDVFRVESINKVRE